MSAPSDRRGFLRGLVSLPLIGGGVTLIGSPTAVAMPLSEQLLDSYDAWLEYERRYLKWERYRDRRPEVTPGMACVWLNQATGETYDYVPCANGGSMYHSSDNPARQAQPSSRAALVLSAVGCDWREGSR
ncbi:hypothetical protein FV226_21780 [Methylobacterium sp. WL12]|uniref:hypothetical protein n=1 Tax=Methylobacterium sp. WL12 TaxID=2603890 RepID=UPI0011CBF437|nr:hypothetical protein [Methylobacterium sp. WL12]TXM67465.1 hypothetical protein FV226_21780 [Methylobacterium sp. WL12]